MNQSAYVSFIRPMNWDTLSSLLNACNQMVNNKIKQLHLLMSSPGGQISPSLAAFNQLKGLPIQITTYNIGSIGSSAIVIFLAGTKRYASANATFLFNKMYYESPYATDEETIAAIKAYEDKIGELIYNTNLNKEDINALFAQSAIKDANYALKKLIIHGIEEVEIPAGALIIQV